MLCVQGERAEPGALDVRGYRLVANKTGRARQSGARARARGGGLTSPYAARPPPQRAWQLVVPHTRRGLAPRRAVDRAARKPWYLARVHAADPPARGVQGLFQVGRGDAGVVVVVHGHGGAPLVQRRVELVPGAPPLGSRVVSERSPSGPTERSPGESKDGVHGAREPAPPLAPPVLRRVAAAATRRGRGAARAAHHGVHGVAGHAAAALW
eukprot:scaffold92143_cov69-Phaeocystis_antarctica.AAC.4